MKQQQQSSVPKEKEVTKERRAVLQQVLRNKKMKKDKRRNKLKRDESESKEYFGKCLHEVAQTCTFNKGRQKQNTLLGLRMGLVIFLVVFQIQVV